MITDGGRSYGLRSPDCFQDGFLYARGRPRTGPATLSPGERSVSHTVVRGGRGAGAVSGGTALAGGLGRRSGRLRALVPVAACSAGTAACRNRSGADLAVRPRQRGILARRRRIPGRRSRRTE